jgi:hypothetical protein
LNSGGFYDYLLQHLRRLAAEGFLYGALEDQFTILKSADDFRRHLSL